MAEICSLSDARATRDVLLRLEQEMATTFNMDDALDCCSAPGPEGALIVLGAKTGHALFEHPTYGLFNVTKMQAYVAWRDKVSPLPCDEMPLPPAEFLEAQALRGSIRRDHALSLPPAVLEIPGIAIHLDDGELLMLDGAHRAYARYARGLGTMTMYVFENTNLDMFRVRMFNVSPANQAAA